MDAIVGNRISFAQAMTDGISIFDLPDLAARLEIEAVVIELEKAQWL